MNELINAAKAVIEWWRHTDPSDLPIEQLIAAVERAESDENIDQINQEAMNIHMSGLIAERERIRDIIKAVGVQGNSDDWFNACDTIMERIDE